MRAGPDDAAWVTDIYVKNTRTALCPLRALAGRLRRRSLRLATRTTSSPKSRASPPALRRSASARPTGTPRASTTRRARTHLWIVNRAFDLLAARRDAQSRPPSGAARRRRLPPVVAPGPRRRRLQGRVQRRRVRRRRRWLDDAARPVGRDLGLALLGSRHRAQLQGPEVADRLRPGARAPQQRARAARQESRERVLRARPVAALLHRPHAADARVELHGQGLAARAPLRLRELRHGHAGALRRHRPGAAPTAGDAAAQLTAAAHASKPRWPVFKRRHLPPPTPRAAAANSRATGPTTRTAGRATPPSTTSSAIELRAARRPPRRATSSPPRCASRRAASGRCR